MSKLMVFKIIDDLDQFLVNLFLLQRCHVYSTSHPGDLVT